jgi:putative ABC transport system permease protein
MLLRLAARGLLRRRGRYALTAAGIALGVAATLGVATANATVDRGLQRRVERVTGKADVTANIVNPDSPLTTELVHRLNTIPGVKAAASGGGFPLMYLWPDRPINQSTSAGRMVQGINSEAIQHLYRLDRSSGRAPRAGAMEIAVPRSIARQQRISLGMRVPAFWGQPGQQSPTRGDLHVVAILPDEDVGLRSGIFLTGRPRIGQLPEKVSYTSLETIEANVGTPKIFSISIFLERGEDPLTWILRHEREFPTVAFRWQGEVRRTLEGVRRALGAVAALALFIGAFLIYLTFLTAVAERTRLYGTLTALGATSGQVAGVVLAEATALGVVSSLAGVAMGIGLAELIIGRLSMLVGLSAPPLLVPRAWTAVAFGTGIATTILAALIPARRASRVSPVDAMRGLADQESDRSRAWAAGLALMLAGVGLAVSPRGFPTYGLRNIGYVFLPLGAVLLVPAIFSPLARLIGRVAGRVARGMGPVAVMHLVKQRRRSAYTLALIMVVLAVTMTMGAAASSIRRTVTETLAKRFGADVQVYGGTIDEREEDLDVKVSRIPGAGRITALRFSQASVPGLGAPARVVVIDPDTFFAIAGFIWLQGSDAGARAALALDNSILMSDLAAKRTDKHLGDKVVIAGRRFRVAGTYQSIDNNPELIAGLAAGRAWFGAGRPQSVLVSAAPGAGANQLESNIRRALPFAYVQTFAQLKAQVTRNINSYLTVFFGILFVAWLVGMLGLANTLAMSVITRFREIGVLQAVGADRGHLRGMVMTESITLSAVALVLAIPLAYLITALLSTLSRTGTDGNTIPFVSPLPWAPWAGAAALLVGLVAAMAPARRASRIDPVAALRTE